MACSSAGLARAIPAFLREASEGAVEAPFDDRAPASAGAIRCSGGGLGRRAEPPPSVLAAEIRAPDLGIGEQLIARPLRARLAHDEDVPAPTQAEGPPPVLLDEHDTAAAPVDFGEPVQKQPLGP